MILGDLCQSSHTTAFYRDSDTMSQDQHYLVHPEDLLTYLGESEGDFSRMEHKGVTGWIYTGYLSTIQSVGQ